MPGIASKDCLEEPTSRAWAGDLWCAVHLIGQDDEMDKSRAEAFSDGVLAVAITLLALDLHVEATGSGTLVHQLSQSWPSFVAYVWSASSSLA